MMDKPDEQEGITEPKKRGNADHPAFKAAMWKKGQSGNPKGRTPRHSISRAMKQLLESTYYPENSDSEKFPKGGISGYELIARALFREAKMGDRLAIKDIQERDEGKVPDVVDVYQNAEGERP